METQEEYDNVLSSFPFHDEMLEVAPFPKILPFSSMVPKVYQQVKEFIYACLKFSEDLHLRYKTTVHIFSLKDILTYLNNIIYSTVREK